MRDTGRVARLASIAVAFVVFALPSQAAAQFAFGGPLNLPSEDYGPGITVSGAGFAPLGQRDRAAGRAMDDARRRAQAVATALGVSLGGVRAVELSAPFDPRPACKRSRNARCSPLEAVSAETTFAIAGGPDSDDGAREITATGAGTAPVDARRNSPSIRRATRAARLAATPGAAEAARTNAEAAATAAGLPLGPLFSVVEPGNLYGYEPVLGAFGPGRFCAIVRRAIVRRDPETGEPRVVGRKRVRRCYVQRTFPVRLEVTYLGG